MPSKLVNLQLLEVGQVDKRLWEDSRQQIIPQVPADWTQVISYYNRRTSQGGSSQQVGCREGDHAVGKITAAYSLTHMAAATQSDR
jgi:hypothetical protein